MAKPTKRKVPGGTAPSTGRVTPKGGSVPRAAAGRPSSASGSASGSGRYTPPTAAVKLKPSGRWVPYTVFTLLGLGLLTIIVNYLRDDAASNWVIFLGLGFILSGILVATRWR